MKIEKRLICDIHESEYNPRVSLDKFSPEYKSIKKSIEDYGFVEPIVVNDINMACVGGHQRLSILRDMGETEIDCVIVHIEDPEKEKALCIALNKINGEWDNDKLDELLHDEEIKEFETGFENIDVVFDDESYNSDGNFDDDYSSNSDDDSNSESDDESDDDNTVVDGLIDDEIVDSTIVIKIGNFRFDTSVSKYEEMIASIRDRGIFEKDGIIEELRRKLFSD